jgi:hypothetical protein
MLNEVTVDLCSWLCGASKVLCVFDCVYIAATHVSFEGRFWYAIGFCSSLQTVPPLRQAAKALFIIFFFLLTILLAFRTRKIQANKK